jgi:hypothetical protein
MTEKATLLVNSDVIDDAPNHAFTVSAVSTNSDDHRVLKPVNSGRDLDNISSAVIDESATTVDFLFDDGSERSYKVEFFEWWDNNSLVYVFGHSDDLVELRGSIRDEYNIHEEARFKIGNTEFEVQYNQSGEWEFNVIESGSDIAIIDSVGSYRANVFCEYSQLLTIKSSRDIDDITEIR